MFNIKFGLILNKGVIVGVIVGGVVGVVFIVLIVFVIICWKSYNLININVVGKYVFCVIKYEGD